MRISIVAATRTVPLAGPAPRRADALACADSARTYTWPVMSDLAAAEAPPHPLIGQLSALHHFRVYVDIGVVVVVLVLTNLLAHFTTPWANVVVVPAAAVGLVLLVRSRGLGWSELGLGRDHWRSGAWYAVGAVALVGTVVAPARCCRGRGRCS